MNTDAYRDLGRSLDGDLILPGDGGYDEARTLFNAMIDKRPSAIARCATVADVQKALVLAREVENPALQAELEALPAAA